MIVSHLEPDHAYNIELLCKKYPKMQIIGNARTFNMIPQFFDIPNFKNRQLVVGDGGSIDTGKHVFRFLMAPMIHWPEVMFVYEKENKIMFTADAFGKFGTIDVKEDWIPEARRYYFNIVGKYGSQVQAILKKISPLKIDMICPLHGPILKGEQLRNCISNYNDWSLYRPDEEGVFIAYASIYGNTAEVAKKLVEMLEEKGETNVVLMDLSKLKDMSLAVDNAFKYNKMVLAASTYDAGVFPPMERFLNILKSKNFQNRKVGIIENGSWAPTAAKVIQEKLSGMQNIKLCNNIVTIKSKMKDEDLKILSKLAKELLK